VHGGLAKEGSVKIILKNENVRHITCEDHWEERVHARRLLLLLLLLLLLVLCLFLGSVRVVCVVFLIVAKGEGCRSP